MTTDLDPSVVGPAEERPGTLDHGSPVPPSARPTWVKGALIGGAAACGCAAIALANPTDTGVPVCWSAGLFGVDCPLCGGLRCVNAMVRGDWIAAADHNLLLVAVLPVAAIVWALWMLAAVRGRTWRWPSVPLWAWWGAGLLTVGFTVVRNMDLGPFAHYLAATSG